MGTEGSDYHAQLVEMLRSQGYSEEEVEKVLAHIRRYERETQTDSVMDSIAKGSFDLASIIKEALGKSDAG